MYRIYEIQPTNSFMRGGGKRRGEKNFLERELSIWGTRNKVFYGKEREKKESKKLLRKRFSCKNSKN